MSKARPEFSRVGLTREQLYARADKFRLQILDLVNDKNGVTAKQLAAHFNMDVHHVRDHAETMVKLGCLRKEKGNPEIVFKATGRPYEHKRKEFNPKAKRVAKDTFVLPEARVFRLLDRRPEEISKQEHEANRRRSYLSGAGGSSMGMFDGF